MHEAPRYWLLLYQECRLMKVDGGYTDQFVCAILQMFLASKDGNNGWLQLIINFCLIHTLNSFQNTAAARPDCYRLYDLLHYSIVSCCTQ